MKIPSTRWKIDYRKLLDTNTPNGIDEKKLVDNLENTIIREQPIKKLIIRIFPVLFQNTEKIKDTKTNFQFKPGH